MGQRILSQGIKPSNVSKGGDNGKGVFLPVSAVRGSHGDRRGSEAGIELGEGHSGMPQGQWAVGSGQWYLFLEWWFLQRERESLQADFTTYKKEL